MHAELDVRGIFCRPGMALSGKPRSIYHISTTEYLPHSKRAQLLSWGGALARVRWRAGWCVAGDGRRMQRTRIGTHPEARAEQACPGIRWFKKRCRRTLNRLQRNSRCSRWLLQTHSWLRPSETRAALCAKHH